MTDLEMLTALGLNKFIDPSNLVDAVVDRRNNPVKGISAPWSKLDGMFEIPRQGVTLIGGYSGHQKSTLSNQWALHAANTGHKVCIASLELTTEYLFDFLAGQSACMTDMHEDYLRRFGSWADDRLFIVDHHDVMQPDEVINLIQDAKRLLGADLFVLDCLFQVDTGGELEHEKRFMQQLAVTARDFEIGIVVVHHMRKSAGPEGEKRVPNKHDFIGSSHLTNAAAAVLILWENKAKSAKRSNGEEVDDDDPDFILSVAKNRFGPYEGAIGLYKHEKARLLCNSRARQYKPIQIPKEDVCQSEESITGESPSEVSTDTFPMKRTLETTSGIEPTTQRTGTGFPF
jgi:twinkle protein